MDKTIHYPYNETFLYYAEPRAGKRALEFVDRKNKEKGGTWVLHTKAQYDEWYRAIGEHQEHLRYGEKRFGERPRSPMLAGSERNNERKH
jgi:hypothetical protein